MVGRGRGAVRRHLDVVGARRQADLRRGEVAHVAAVDVPVVVVLPVLVAQVDSPPPALVDELRPEGQRDDAGRGQREAVEVVVAAVDQRSGNRGANIDRRRVAQRIIVPRLKRRPCVFLRSERRSRHQPERQHERERA